MDAHEDDSWSWRFGLRTMHRMFFLTAGVVTLCFGFSHPVQAQTTTKIYQLVVTTTDNADPIASKGTLIYTFSVKNLRIASGSVQTKNATLVAPLPAGVTFVKCTTSIDTASVKRCKESGGTITATFPSMGANVTRKVTLTLKAPDIATHASIQITGTATGENAFKGDDTESTSVLAPNTTVTLSPSLQQKPVQCGETLDSAFFGADTSAQLDAGLGCAESAFGLRIDASNVTLNLGGKKIVAEPILGNTGIVIGAGATNVTVNGQGRNGTNGIEFFDWCLQDEGGNTGLVVTDMRCFRARSTALDIMSDNVFIEKLTIDNTVFASGVTTELPGGIGIRGRGDNIHVKETTVRRSRTLGIWLDGLDTDGNGRAGTVDGNVTSSRVEDNAGVGIFLQHGPHLVKDTTVQGDGFEDGTSTDGIVVDTTAVSAKVEGVSIKEHHGNGIVVNGNGAQIQSCNVESTAGDSFVIAGANTVLNNNSAESEGDGFVLIGPDSILTTNHAEKTGGIGFLITGPRAMLSGNSAMENKSHGYVLGGESAWLDTNSSEKNLGRGMRITGNGNLVEHSKIKNNRGIGVEVPGQSNRLRNNGVERSTGMEWSIGANNIDLGGNSANGRPFSFTAAGGTFE